MRVIVRSDGVRLRLPIPLSVASAAVSLLPEAALTDFRNSVPAPYNELVTKEFLRDLVRQCRSLFRQYKGLEIVHVETKDGTFVSIRL